MRYDCRTEGFNSSASKFGNICRPRIKQGGYFQESIRLVFFSAQFGFSFEEDDARRANQILVRRGNYLSFDHEVDLLSGADLHDAISGLHL